MSIASVLERNGRVFDQRLEACRGRRRGDWRFSWRGDGAGRRSGEGRDADLSGTAAAHQSLSAGWRPYPNGGVLNQITDKLTYQNPKTLEIEPWIAESWT